MKQIILAIFALLLSACAITNETSLVIGNQRASISPDSVKLYIELPEKYEVIALITADAAHDFMSKQSLQEIAIKNLKIEAAKVGANGILLDNVGNFSIGTTGILTAPEVSVIGVAAITNRTGKQASGKAIYVQQD